MRRLVCLAFALLLSPAAVPAFATHGSLSVTRAPAGLALAGSVLTVTATVENTDDVLDLVDATLNAQLTDPYLAFIAGTVTARWREQNVPAGIIRTGNSPGDDSVLVELEPLPPGYHADVSFKLQVVSRLPAGVESALAQVFLTYYHQVAQSIPWYLTVPIAAEPALTLTKTDFDQVFRPGGAPVTYQIVVRNDGTQEATGLTLTDSIPDFARFEPASSDGGWSCVPGSGPGSACTLSFPSLAAGDGKAFAFTLAFEPGAAPAGLDAVRNTAQARDDGTNTTGSDVPKQAFAYEDTPVDAAPDLTLSKDDGGVSRRPGERVVYQLAFGNSGSQDGTGVVLEETVPERSTFVAGASDPGWVCAGSGAAGASCTLAVGGLAVGASGSAAFAVRVDSALPAGVGEITNSARIRDDGKNGADLQAADNLASDTTPVAAAPDLVLVKEADRSSVRPGETVVYTLRLRNDGDQAASGVVVEEVVPAETRFVGGASDPGWSCSPGPGAGSVCRFGVGGLAAGGSRAVRFAVRLGATVPAAVGRIVNTASVRDDGGNGPDPNPGDNSSTVETPVEAAPDLVVSKDDGGVSVRPGESVVYAIGFVNAGDQGATGVVLEETVPGQAVFDGGGSDPGWSCSLPAAAAEGGGKGLKAERIQESLVAGAEAGSSVRGFGGGSRCTFLVGDLPAGASGSVGFALAVVSPVPVGFGELVNTVVVRDDGANGDDPTPGDNRASETTPVEAAPDLVVSKSDGGVTAGNGESVVYTISYRNEGDRDAAGVVLEETVPRYTAFHAAASDPDWSCASGGTAGDRCTLSLGSVPGGTGGSVVFAVRVAAVLPAGVEEIVNSVSVAHGGGPGGSATETTPVDAAPVLLLAKDDGGVTVRPGEAVVYTLTFRNGGDQAASGVVLEEVVPEETRFEAGSSDAGWSCAPDGGAGSTCTLAVGGLYPGAPRSVRFAVRLDGELPAAVRSIFNRAVLRDDDGGSAFAEEVTPIAGSLDLALSKDDGGVEVRAGETIVYTLSVRNDGDVRAAGVVLEETVPEETTLVPEASDAGWSCSPPPVVAARVGSRLEAERVQERLGGAAVGETGAGAVCTLAVGDLSPGASASVAFAVAVGAEVAAGVVQIENTASVRDDGSGGADADPSNNRATETTPILPPSGGGGGGGGGEGGTTLDLYMSDRLVEDRDGSGSVTGGDVLLYSVRVENTGSAAAETLVFEVPRPEFTKLLPKSVRGASALGVMPTDDLLRVRLADLPAGESAALVWEVEIDRELPEGLRSLRAQGRVESSTAPSHPSDDPDTTVPDDPTVTPLGRGGEAGGPVDVPTLSEWGLLLLTLLLSLTAWRVLR